MMKKIVYSALSIFIITFAFSCAPLSTQSDRDDTSAENNAGGIHFSLQVEPAGLRTIVPSASAYDALSDFDSDSFTLEIQPVGVPAGTGSAPFAQRSITVDTADGKITNPAISGVTDGNKYTAYATAKINGISAAAGKMDFTAINNSGVAITLKPIPPNKAGTESAVNSHFRYSISIPKAYSASVSFKGPRAAGGTKNSGDDALEGNPGYKTLDSTFSSRLEGDTNYVYTMPSLPFKGGIYDFIITVYEIATVDVSAPSRVLVDETVYLYSGLTTEATGSDYVFNSSAIDFSDEVLFTGSLNIINTGKQALGDIYIVAYKGLDGKTGNVRFNPISPTTIPAAISGASVIAWCTTNSAALNTSGKAKWTNSSNASSQLVTVNWGMTSSSIINGDDIYLKAFTSNTHGVNASVTNLFLESDKKAAEDLAMVSYTTNGALSKIALSDKVIGPPVLLSASVYDDDPDLLVLVFDQAATVLSTGRTADWKVINSSNLAEADDVATISGIAKVGGMTNASYTWHLTLSNTINAANNVYLSYTADNNGAYLEGYNIPMASGVHEIRNGTSALPSLISAVVQPSDTDPRIGEAVILTFDKEIKMPDATSVAAGWGIASPSSNTGLGAVWSEHIYTKDQSLVHAAPAAFAAYPLVADGSANDGQPANGTGGTGRSSRIWKLNFATTSVLKNDNAEYPDSYLQNNFMVVSDSIGLNYTPQEGKALLDSNGQALGKITNNFVSNTISALDWAEPVLARAYVTNADRDIVNLVFTEAVKIEAASSALAGFSLLENSIASSKDFAAIAPANEGAKEYASLWQLSLETGSEFKYGENITIKYVSDVDGPTGNTVYDNAGNYLAATTLAAGIEIENQVVGPPLALSAVVNNDNPSTSGTDESTQIILTFSKAVKIPVYPVYENETYNNFTITSTPAERVDKPTAITAVTISGGDGEFSTTWKLSLDHKVLYGDSIELEYTDPGYSSGNDYRIVSNETVPTYVDDWTINPVANNVGEIVKLNVAFSNNSNGKGTIIPSAGEYDRTINSSVTVTAIPSATHKFIGWYGTAVAANDDLEDVDNNYTFTIEGNTSLYAKFIDSPKLTMPQSPTLSNTGLASWTIVSSSAEEYNYISGYNIYLYKNTTPLNNGAAIFVSGKASNLRNIRTELMDAAQGSFGTGSDYNFRVEAVSINDTIYNNSDQVTSGDVTVTQLALNENRLSWTAASGPSYTANWNKDGSALTTSIGATADATYTFKLYKVGDSFTALYTKTDIPSDILTSAGITPPVNLATTYMNTNGSYYFTLQAIAASNTLFYNSEIVQSPTQAVGQSSITSGFSDYEFPDHAAVVITRNNNKPTTGDGIPPHVLNITDNDTITLAVSGANTATDNIPAGSDTIKWYVDNVHKDQSDDEDSFTYTPTPSEGFHTISVQAVIDGFAYSAGIRVRVVL
jgi:hypothetical protein